MRSLLTLATSKHKPPFLLLFKYITHKDTLSEPHKFGQCRDTETQVLALIRRDALPVDSSTFLSLILWPHVGSR